MRRPHIIRSVRPTDPTVRSGRPADDRPLGCTSGAPIGPRPLA